MAANLPLGARLKRLAKLYYLKVMRTKATPQQISRGVACGVFGGCFPALPPLPLQTLIAVLAAFVVRGSKIPAIVATWVSNPLNWAFFYIAQYRIGTLFIPMDRPFDPLNWALSDYLHFGWRGLAAMLLGALFIAVPLSVVSYVVVLPLVKRYRRRRALRILRKKTRQ